MKHVINSFKTIINGIFLALISPVLIVVGLIFLFAVSYGIYHYYDTRMVYPIEWEILSEDLYGKKISAEFSDMRSHQGFYSTKKTFRIGITKNLILPGTLFIYDPKSVQPDSVKLVLDDPEFLEYRNWNEEKKKWIPTGKTIRFTVTNDKSLKIDQ